MKHVILALLCGLSGSAALLAFVVPTASVCSQEPMPVIPTDVNTLAKLDLPPANFTQQLPNLPIKFEMIYIPGGEFVMGSPEGETGRLPHEGPQRKVKIKPFWLGKFEVTWDEYYAFWNDERLYKTGEIPEAEAAKLKADAITRPTNAYVPELYDMGKDGHPAICMSHHSAMMYCHWLRWQTKRGYRLPTEAEWEYACRAGTTGPYSFDPAQGKLGDYAWYKDNSATKEHTDAADEKEEDQGRTHKVGTKKPNNFGLYDMHGNVAEWVLDHWDEKFYSTLPADKLVLGPVNKPTDRKWGHVVRGGSWADTADRLRSAARRGSDRSWMKHDPQVPRSIWWLTKMDMIGFRVALPVEEYPELIGLKPMVEKKVD